MPATDKERALAIAKDLNREVNILLLAKTYAKTKREQVDKIQRDLLASEPFYGRQRPDMERFRITDPKDDFLMVGEPDFERYIEKLKQIHLTNGYADAAKGFCPALVAENLEIKAEHLVLEKASRHLGADLTQIFLEKREHALDLIVRLVVNAPGYVPPEIPKP